MIDQKQIPDEVVEAAKHAYAEVYWAGEATPKAYRAAIQAAIAAGLAAWPGANRAEAWDNTIRHGDLILPPRAGGWR